MEARPFNRVRAESTMMIHYGKIMSKKIIALTQYEICVLINILNEVCNGFYIDNFEQKIGEREENVLKLMEKLKNAEKKIGERHGEALDLIGMRTNKKESTCCELEYTEHEMLIFRDSFKEVIKEIEEWEFHTRLGSKISQVQAIVSKFQ